MWPELAPFLATALAMELTPGPNMAWLALTSAQKGRGVGLSAVAGVALGLLVIGLAAMFGFGALVAQSPTLYAVLHWAGVVYLLWLGWDTWREAQRAPEEGEVTSHVRAFQRGLVTNLLNPKAFLFYLTVLPGFIPVGETLVSSALVLTLLYVGVATLVHLGVIAGAGGLTGLLQHPKRRRTAGLIFALLLVAVAAWLALKFRA